MKVSQTLRLFFTPEALVPFLIGIVSTAVIGNEVTQVLDNIFGTSSRASLGISAGALAVLLFCAWLLKHWIARIKPEVAEFQQQAPMLRKGLILLVGRAEVCRQAILYHRPVLERCWLICSARTLEVAQSMRREFSDEVKFPEPVVINDINNPLEYAARVGEIYRNLPEGWKDDDVIADYTGMTAHGSVGVALACLSPVRPLQYMPAIFNEDLEVIDSYPKPIEVKLVGKEPA